MLCDVSIDDISSQALNHALGCFLLRRTGIVNCPLLTVHCPLSIVNCPLLTVHCPLSIVNCSLLIVSSSGGQAFFIPSFFILNCSYQSLLPRQQHLHQSLLLFFHRFQLLLQELDLPVGGGQDLSDGGLFFGRRK